MWAARGLLARGAGACGGLSGLDRGPHGAGLCHPGRVFAGIASCPAQLGPGLVCKALWPRAISAQFRPILHLTAPWPRRQAGSTVYSRAVMGRPFCRPCVPIPAMSRATCWVWFCAVLRWRRLAPWKSCIGLALRPISARPWPWNTALPIAPPRGRIFWEGIRAAIIDKDRAPRWRHAGLAEVCAAEVEAMLAPLGAAEMTFETEGERL